jgi:hypothetical protein
MARTVKRQNFKVFRARKLAETLPDLSSVQWLLALSTPTR